MLIGDWSLDLKKNEASWEVPPPDTHMGPEIGYEFCDSNIVKVKSGFYLPWKKNDPSRWAPVYRGIKTWYRVRNGQLGIYNLSDSTWHDYKISRLTKDSLTIGHKTGNPSLFKRSTYCLDSIPEFDRIQLTSSCSLGNCPNLNISVCADGSVLFIGEGPSLKQGYYTAKLSKKAYNELQDYFRKAESLHLNSTYYSGGTDGQSIVVGLFEKNNNCKWIDDYNHSSPREFMWASNYLQDLYQLLALEKVAVTRLPVYTMWDLFFFQEGNRIGVLSREESFLLWTLIEKGKVTSQQSSVALPMELVITDERAYIQDRDKSTKGKLLMPTDGRYFAIAKNGTTTIIDIGFNFIDAYLTKSQKRPTVGTFGNDLFLNSTSFDPPKVN